MRRPQFSIRALLVLMLVVAAFFGGIRFERERRIREERASQGVPQFEIHMDWTDGGQKAIIGSSSAPVFFFQNPAVTSPADSAPRE